MWKKKLDSLQKSFPEAIRLYQPADNKRIKQTEQLLGIELSAVDVGWLDFLEVSNGASILAYCILGAMSSHIANITDINEEYKIDNSCRWLRDQFIIFMSDSSPMNIGFVRDGPRTRCIAFLSEPSDTAVLPIASSLNAFMDTFLKDVEVALRSWKPHPGEKWPYTISDTWPLNMKTWCESDVELKTLLQQGMLDDLFKHNDEYSDLVDQVILT